MFGFKPEIIKELEETFGKKIKKVDFEDVWRGRSFSVDLQGAVIGLNLWGLNITNLSPINSLTALKDLYLNLNQITDLSPLIPGRVRQRRRYPVL
jgi:hypothetical protein